jgi:hypothetical protein
MTDIQDIPDKNKPKSKGKLRIGVVILVVGFLSPLLIPLVVASNWTATTKSIVSGLLAFGVPELFMLVAIVVMGKPGYQYIKEKFGKYLQRYLPPDKVSRRRYYLGMVFFSIPILVGIFQPYLDHFFPIFKGSPLWFHYGLDMIFVIGIFILGGNFWDKLRGLFQPKAIITKTH